jgi:hypothetical protein
MKKLSILLLSLLLLNITKAQTTYTGLFKSNDTNTEFHHFVRNGGGAAVYINQVSTSNPILRLSSGIANANQLVKFSVENNGWVGIGTTNISEKLTMYTEGTSQVATLYGNTNTGLGSGNGFLVGIESAGNGIIWNRENNFIRFGTNALERMRLTADGKLGLGTTIPVDRLTVVASMPEISLRGKVPNQFEGGRIRFGEYSNTNDQGAYIHYNASANIFNIGVHHASNGDDINSDYNAISIIRSTGNVGIGTQAPGTHKLAVNGTIRAKEIKVETDWADFVFEDDYQLMKLSDLEEFIQENGHLPEIPTEKEVEENGVSLGEMNSKLLQKIEELTLYTIQLQKENKNLQKQQNDQLKQINAQQQIIENLQKLEERLSRLEDLK